MQTAYSYLRFSTPSQARADKIVAQLEQAREYADANGLTLDENLSFQDLGISAYRGANIRVGQLGDFLRAVQHGEVKRDSYLLVESLDRISRDSARKALRTLANICDEGITVVTLIDGQEYTTERLDNDPMALLVSLVIFMRANEESATRSKRIRSAWGRRIQRIRDGEKIKLCGSLPSWIRLEDDKFVIEKEKAKTVRMIFRMGELGIGTLAIAKALNLNQIPTLGSLPYWNKTQVNLFLTHIAVTGTLIPSSYEIIDGQRVPITFEPLKGYYPRLISQKTWNKAQTFVEVRRKKFRVDGDGNRSRTVRNIFAYTSKCPHCGHAMNLRDRRFENKFPGTPWHLFICAFQANGGNCEAKPVQYEPLERAFLEMGPKMMRAHLAFLSANKPNENSGIDHREWRNLQPRVSAVIELMGNLETDREQINQRIRKLFDRVVINYPDKKLDFEWIYGGQTSMPVADIGDSQIERISIQSKRKPFASMIEEQE